MTRAKPKALPPLPHEGGSYVLQDGEWVKEQEEPAAPEPESVTPNDDGALPETTAAG